MMSPANPCRSLDRRAFLKTAAMAAGAAAVDVQARAAEEPVPPPAGLIDVNVNLSRWPLRRPPGPTRSRRPRSVSSSRRRRAASPMTPMCL